MRTSKIRRRTRLDSPMRGEGVLVPAEGQIIFIDDLSLGSESISRLSMDDNSKYISLLTTCLAYRRSSRNFIAILSRSHGAREEPGARSRRPECAPPDFGGATRRARVEAARDHRSAEAD